MNTAKSTHRLFLAAVTTTALLLGPSCSNKAEDIESSLPRKSVPVAAPLNVADAVAVAKTTPIEEREPIDWPDLHNIYHLSENVISGSEPHGEDALKRIAAMGVKTIVSVDGKEPDVETARKLGMKYVHIPIRYSGIKDDELLRMTKTFTEQEGPFFVHCFHGKHRGPAAAAVARVVIDGAPRETALAEMRQWMGTSEQYTGLYGTIANKEMPDAETVKAYEYDFPGKAGFDGYRGMMVAAPRHFDAIADLAPRDFKPDPSHPDADAANEAVQLAQAFSNEQILADLTLEDAKFQELHHAAVKEINALRDFLLAAKAGDAQALASAKDQVKVVKGSCSACHKVYRNN